MAYQNIIVEKPEPGIAKITLNRPDRRNPLSRQTLLELVAAAQEIGADEEVRAVILTGSGRAFATGADLEERPKIEGFWQAHEVIHLLYQAFHAIENMPQPVIAAINGYAFGGGHELALACDISIASEKAQIAYPEIDFAMPSVVHAALLTRAAPIGWVKELLYTGKRIDAREAERWGLVNRVVPPEELEEAALELARNIARKEPHGMRLQKELINKKWLRADLETAIWDGIDAAAIAYSTGEPQRRMAAFMEERRRAKGG